MDIMDEIIGLRIFAEYINVKITNNYAYFIIEGLVFKNIWKKFSKICYGP